MGEKFAALFGVQLPQYLLFSFYQCSHVTNLPHFVYKLIICWKNAILYNIIIIVKLTECVSVVCSVQLLLFMKEFSQKVVSKTHEIEKQVDSLIHEAKVLQT